MIIMGFIEFVKFLGRIFTGEVPVVQLYMMIAMLVVAVGIYVMFEVRKMGEKDILGLAIEGFFVGGFTLFMYTGGYIIGWNVIARLGSEWVPEYDVAVVSWFAVISFACAVLLLPLSIKFAQLDDVLPKITMASVYFVLMIGLILCMNHFVAPRVDIPLMMLLVNVAANMVIAFLIACYVKVKMNRLTKDKENVAV
ncbi:hypothetical protein [Shouchella lonarensis]|uniref:Uncharacterized protein n=1 Tax=Shouchella lonarensis TaxID=1464122 RepID=A0A1G6NF54_9BACI|nr:hypothetical protein [Shouchella lonarensis]SDC65907.1 hypothetical protein SAMN05421737_11252 [Shouchella lonarensis]